jgi:hypothetical protein
LNRTFHYLRGKIKKVSYETIKRKTSARGGAAVSATNRGAKRVPQDLYPTPVQPAFKPLLPYIPRDGEIWEPACGDRRLIHAMAEHGLKADGDDIVNGYDFLEDVTRRFCLLTNPPFSLAFEFMQHAANIAEHVFLLLRLNFLASLKRKAWFIEHEPALFVLSSRPSFCRSVECRAKCGWKESIPAETLTPKECPDCGGKVRVTESDACEYGWFYWGNAHQGIIHL